MRTQKSLSYFVSTASLSLFCLVSLLLLPQTASGDVLFDFDSNAEGFSSSSSNVVSQRSLIDKNLRITSPGGLSAIAFRNNDVFRDFTLGSPLQQELALAAANGGTISFDIEFDAADFQYVEDSPAFFQIALKTQGAFYDVALTTVNFPTAGTGSETVSFNIVGDSGTDDNQTDGNIQYQEFVTDNEVGPTSGSGSIAFSLHDPDATFSTGAFAIDNVAISANLSPVSVPEPASGTLLVMAAVGLSGIRRRRLAVA